MARESYLPLGVLGLAGRLASSGFPRCSSESWESWVLRRRGSLPLLRRQLPDTQYCVLLYAGVIWFLCGLRTSRVINGERESGSWECFVYPTLAADDGQRPAADRHLRSSLVVPLPDSSAGCIAYLTPGRLAMDEKSFPMASVVVALLW